MTRTQTIERLHVGDHVRVSLGSRKMDGIIVEDRGGVGVGGRRLFVVRMPMDPAEPLTIEVPGAQIEPSGKLRKLEKAKIVSYLRNGGLIAILGAVGSDGQDQPRVWLRYDSLGNVTHTVAKDFGVIGGEMVPSQAIRDEKILRPKVDEVRKFLRSFGLTADEAMDVIKSVGTVA